MPLVGQMFSDRYEIGPEIGRGGMAEVFLARDRLLDRDVAVKVLSSSHVSDPTFVARFRREARAAASLNHHNIVAVYDWGEEGDTYFIVMEYVAGRTLRDVLRTYERLPIMEASRIAGEIADALAFAHRNGVVHRDVKPGNVLLTPSGSVKVTDFGIAHAEAAEDLTKTGSVMGTATYFSPEQAQGRELDGRTDVYSLGVVLYEMLTGVAPFVADNPVSVAYKHVREQAVPPSHIAPDVPGALDRVVLTAIEKNPDARYQSAVDLRADLMRFERGRPLAGGPILPVAAAAASGAGAAPTVAMPVAAPRPAPATARPSRGRGAVVTVAVACAVLLALITVLIVQSNFGDSGSAAPKVDVPTVVGQQFAPAEAALTGQGFVVKRVDDDSSDQAPDQVLSQNPEGGSRATKGSVVTLGVSSTTIAVPDVVGKTRDQAASIMQQHRLKPNFVEQDAADKPPGTVLGTDPGAGTRVPKAAAGQEFTGVTVNIAREPPVPIPDVKGQDPDAATTVLNQAGFNSIVRTETPSDTVPVGKVIGTDPPAATPTAKTTPIKLLVSTGPDEIEVPNVVGQTQDAAASQLTGLRFNVTILQASSTPANKGKVFAQSPAPGTKLHKLDNVTITVGV
jgi:serine/threonine-protein kinase